MSKAKFQMLKWSLSAISAALSVLFVALLEKVI